MHRGVVTPNQRGHNVIAKVVNATSKRSTPNTTIRLDKLLKSEKPRVCIQRRLGGIGDVLMSTPLLKSIKRLLPHCHLTYATDLEYSQGALADIINHNPYVDELIAYSESQNMKYDFVSDITRTGLNREKPGTTPPNRIFMFAEQVGVDIASDPEPVYIVTKGEQELAKKKIEKILEGADRKKTTLIAIQTRSNDARRTWPLEYTGELAELLAQDKNFHVLMFDWGHRANQWVKKTRITPMLDMPLSEVAPIVEQADLVICPDSSMLHIAGAFQKKTVAIFGGIPPESRINYYPNTTAAIVRVCNASPCWYSPFCLRNKTSNKLECFTKLTPKMVQDAVLKKLKDPDMTLFNVQYGEDLTEKGQDPIILIKRHTNGIGDLLMATPGIEAFKRKYSNKQVHVAVQRYLHPVLENNPYIDKILDVEGDFNLRRYYFIHDISTPCARYEYSRVTSGKSVEKSRVEIFAEAMGTKAHITGLIPRYYPTREETEWAKQFLKKNKLLDKPFIGVALKSAESYRNWPEEYYPELFEKLSKEFNIVAIHKTREFFSENIIDACGFNFRRAAAVVSQCDGIITIDTGLLHLAAALDIPTIGIFGPIDYRARCKGYKNVTIVLSDLDCGPCWRNGKMPCKKTGKLKGYSKCISSIKPDDIIKITKSKFQETK